MNFDYRVLGAFVAVLALVVTGSVLMVSDSSDAVTSDGTEHGTPTEPLTSIDGSAENFDDQFYYVELGSSLDIVGNDSFFPMDDYTSGFGLRGYYQSGSKHVSGDLISTGALTINIRCGSGPDYLYKQIHIIVVDPADIEFDVEFISPDAVGAVSGGTVSYSSATNVPATFSEDGGTAAVWLDVDSSTGKVTGNVPSVDEVTSFTYALKATSTGDSNNTVVQNITIDVYPIAQISSSALTVSGMYGTVIEDVDLTGNIDMTFDVSEGTLPEGLSLVDGSITGTPQAYGQSSVTIKGTTTEGPVQNPTIVVTFDLAEQEPVLSISADHEDSYKEGTSLSIPLSSNVEGTEWSVSGDAIYFLSVVDGVIVGSIPMTYDEITEVSITVSAVTPQGQEDDLVITFDVEPVIQFTTKPTADCIIVPVYDYNDDGTPVLQNTQSLFSEVWASGADFSFADTLSIRGTFTGENAVSATWYWGDGSADVGNVVEHTYAEPGEYTVTLVAQGEADSDGNIQYDTITLTVQVGDSSSHDLFFIAIIALLVLAVVYLMHRCGRHGRGRRD